MNLQNPLVRKLIGSVIRMILMVVPFAIDISDAELETYVDAIIVLAAGIWEAVHQFRSQAETNTAMAMPKVSTFVEVKREISETGGVSAMISENAVPRLPKP